MNRNQAQAAARNWLKFRVFGAIGLTRNVYQHQGVKMEDIISKSELYHLNGIEYHLQFLARNWDDVTKLLVARRKAKQPE